jgi:hypothetical protein
VSSEEKERSSSLVWVIGALVLAPVLYVLSFGPVAMLWDLAGWDREPVKAAYAPVIWAARNTPLGVPIGAYLRLWGVR